MFYSTAGHHLSQVNTADTEGIVALFRDSVAAYVDAQPGAGDCGTLDASLAFGVSDAAQGTKSADVAPPANTSIRCDVELARIAMALHLSALFRLWLICHQITRDTNNPGVSRAQLDTALQRYGVQGCAAGAGGGVKRLS